MAKMSKEEIKVILSVIKKLRESLEGEETGKKIEEALEQVEKIKNGLNENDEFDLQLKEYFERAIKRIKEDKEGFVRLMIALPALYLLSVITYPHATFTRYPDGKLTPKDYKHGLGIVDCLPDLFHEVKNNIEALKKYLQE